MIAVLGFQTRHSETDLPQSPQATRNISCLDLRKMLSKTRNKPQDCPQSVCARANTFVWFQELTKQAQTKKNILSQEENGIKTAFSPRAGCEPAGK